MMGFFKIRVFLMSTIVDFYNMPTKIQMEMSKSLKLPCNLAKYILDIETNEEILSFIGIKFPWKWEILLE